MLQRTRPDSSDALQSFDSFFLKRTKASGQFLGFFSFSRCHCMTRFGAETWRRCATGSNEVKMSMEEVEGETRHSCAPASMVISSVRKL